MQKEIQKEKGGGRKKGRHIWDLRLAAEKTSREMIRGRTVCLDKEIVSKLAVVVLEAGWRDEKSSKTCRLL